MFLVAKSGFIDFDLDLLVDIGAVLDRHIAAVADASVDSEIADQTGLFDRAEHAAGLGFVACQGYLAATYADVGIAKVEALSLGPTHPTGGRVVGIINAAANYWKHSAEWRLQPNHPGRHRTEEALDSIGFAVGTDYPLSGVLTELSSPRDAGILSLIPLLESWRDELAARAG
jgi:hypothetical protein